MPTTFLANVAVFRPPFQKMWASFDHQAVICKIMGHGCGLQNAV
jgi:hypothetical protein